MKIRPLTEADVVDAMGLVRQVGWNQLPVDWRRLLALAPERCYAGVVGGELVATTTAVTYANSVSWVGMVLVDEEYRRRGYGTEMLQHALEQARPAVQAGVGLDATDEGKPLYRKHGFGDVREITRLCGVLHRDGPVDGVEEFGADRAASLASFDAEACGTDRRALLERLFTEPRTVGYVRPGDDGPAGYAILRPGREHWQLGPIVAVRDDALGPLLDAAAARLDGENVIVDSLANGSAADLLADRGLAPQRRLTRMTSPEGAPLLTDGSVVAAAGLELG